VAKLYFYYASMNAGKSTALLQADFNYRERGMRTLLFTAAVDDRHGAGVIASRVSLSMPAATFSGGTDLLAAARAAQEEAPLACVLVDEAQFLSPAQVDQLACVADLLGVPVLAYGLRTDFLGELFPGSARLLAVADVLAEIKSVCLCGRKATFTARIGDNGAAVRAGAQTEIGGNDRYVALCRRHHREALAGELVLA
jgi:thymidine kinase